MGEKGKLVLHIFVAAILTVVLYILLHEGGHALVAVACGARITRFSILGAYVVSVGGNYNVFTGSLRIAAGAVLPVLLSTLWLLLFKRNRQGSFYKAFSLLFTIMPLMSLWAWILAPISYMAGNTMDPDDTIQFLNTSGLPPVAVMLVSFALFILLTLLAWKRGIFHIWLKLVQRKREGTEK